MTVWKRVKEFGPWSRARLERDLEREIQNHLAFEAGDSGGRGGFGNIALLKEDVREAWGWARLELFARDIHYGLRQVRRNPSFSAIAIATLALGIGGIAAMFSAFDAVLIRPLPYADADRLVMIWDDMSMSRTRDRRLLPHPPNGSSGGVQYRIHRSRCNTARAGHALRRRRTRTGSGAQGDLESVECLGVQPMLGRVFTEDEDTRGARGRDQPWAVAAPLRRLARHHRTQDLAERRALRSDRRHAAGLLLPAVARYRHLDAGFFSCLDANQPGWHDAHIVARLKPGVTLEHASKSMAALSLQVTAKDFRGPHSVLVIPLREELAGKTQTALIVLLCASAALLLIACVNLANLLLSRGAARGREVAVRAALGAGRGRLIAQFLTESLVLAGTRRARGLALALPAMRFLERLVPETMGAARLTLDWRVLAFSAAAAIAAALIFGLAPALRGSRLALAGRTARRRHAAQRARAAIGSSIRSSLSRRRSPSCC